MGLQILIIGRNQGELKQLERVLKLKKYDVTGCLSDDDALKKIQNHPYDALLLTNDMKLESKAIFKQFSREQRPEMPVIEIKESIDSVAEDIEAALIDTGE